MTSKALRKQLLAAVAMVIVAAIAVSSSTFAWFAGNNVVKATEMKVQAVAEGGIEIKHSTQADTAYSTVNASSVTAAATLHPTSTFDGTTWVHATAAASSQFTAAAGSYTALTLGADGVDTSDSKQYFRHDQFQIRTVKGTTTAQKVIVKEIEVTGDPAALDQSLKVLVKVGTGSGAVWYNYNAAAGGSSGRVVATAVVDTDQDGVQAVGNPATVGSVTYLAPNVASNLLCTCAAASNTAAGEAQNVEIYIYYEGEDVNHYSNNLNGALALLNVTVSFEVKDDAAAFSAPTAPAAASTAQKLGTATINAAP